MGVDYTYRRFYGSMKESDLDKLPREVQDLLVDESEINEGPWEGLQVWYDPYSSKPEFRAFGFEFQSVEFQPVEEKKPDTSKAKLFEKQGIDAKVYGFVEVW